MLEHRCPWCGKPLPVTFLSRNLFKYSSARICPHCQKACDYAENLSAASAFVPILIYLVLLYDVLPNIELGILSGLAIFYFLLKVFALFIVIIFYHWGRYPPTKHMTRGEKIAASSKTAVSVDIHWTKYQEGGAIL